MREYRSSGSVEGVMSNHDSYSDVFLSLGTLLRIVTDRGAAGRRGVTRFHTPGAPHACGMAGHRRRLVLAEENPG
jgi:hypothetical protein